MRSSHTGMGATALLHVSDGNMYMSCVVCRYVRAEIVAGFVNALFLLFIAFFIFSEAIEVSRESHHCPLRYVARLRACLVPSSAGF